METIENENSIPNSKKIMAPSSLKNNKFKGLTAEQIIKKYENVLFSREKQFYELSNEITKLTQKIQNLMKKKEKSKYNNDILKDIFSQKQQILKQELSNKEIVFMKLTDLEHKYDDLQMKIDDIINKQNALADSTQREKERMNQDKDEGKKLIHKEIYNDTKEEENNNINNFEKEIIKEEKIMEEKKEENKIEEEQKEEKRENNINDNINKIIIEEDNKNIINDNKEIEEKKENEKYKEENKEKKENSFNLARERLNRLKKEKTEKIKKLNLSELFANQTNNNDNKE
jgi:hypothetical protein